MRTTRAFWMVVGVAVWAAACGSTESSPGPEQMAGAGGTAGGGGTLPDSGTPDVSEDSGGAGGLGGVGGAGGAAGQDASAGAAGVAGLGGGGGIGGAAGGGGIGGLGGAAGTAGSGGVPNPACKPVGDSCASGGDCCSTVCDPTNHLCLRNFLSCSPAGSACADNLECCGLNCVSGLCQGACVADGAACTPGGAACCSGTCDNGTCKDINGGAACLSAGNPCTAGSECCSTLCDNGQCVLGVSYCVQPSDLCTADAQCCSGTCQKAAASDLYGACGTLTVGPNRCEDGAAGMVCAGCGVCCSRACAPGPVGVFICQPPSGCRPAGEICSETTDCCGGDPGAGLPGSAESVVTCEKEAATDLYGRCKSQGCTPQGDVCQLWGGACSESTALPSNCCPTNANPSNPAWKKGECEFDTLLIPRCNGLAECVPAGGYCASSTDCCNDLPCVPDPNDGNKLKCYVPVDGGTTCVPGGGPCTANADCCPPSTCIVPPGEVFGTCGSEGTGGSGGSPPDSGTGGAPPDSGTGGTGGQPGCAAYGQTCGVTSDCCFTSSGVQCINGHCLIQG